MKKVNENWIVEENPNNIQLHSLFTSQFIR